MNNTKGDQTAQDEQKKCENSKRTRRRSENFSEDFIQMKEISCEKENKKILLRILSKAESTK